MNQKQICCTCIKRNEIKMIKNKIFRNASWIIVCRVAQSVCGLVITMLTARYLGPSNYGLINYAASIVAFVTPIMQLGLNNILVQEVVQSPEKEGEIFGTSVIMSLCSSVLCIVALITFVCIADFGEINTIVVCALYSTILIFQAIELIQYWFQAKYLSKYVAVVSLCAYIVISAYKIFLLASGKSIYWFAVSNSLDIMIISFSLLIIYKRLGGGKFKFSSKTAVDLYAKSKYYIVSGLMITVFAQTDKIMLKIMIDETATGYYSAAVACASLTGFVFVAIIDSFRPLIFESKKNSVKEFNKNMIRLYSVIVYLSLFQSLFITLFSKPIIFVIYGINYIDAVPALRIIVWYTTFCYLGSVRNIWILAQNKQKYLSAINLSGALCNVVLNYILIPVWGICGAALASLVTQIFTNVIVGYIIKPIRENNTLMLNGVKISEAIKMIKYIFNKVKIK